MTEDEFALVAYPYDIQTEEMDDPDWVSWFRLLESGDFLAAVRQCRHAIVIFQSLKLANFTHPRIPTYVGVEDLSTYAIVKHHCHPVNSDDWFSYPTPDCLSNFYATLRESEPSFYKPDGSDKLRIPSHLLMIYSWALQALTPLIFFHSNSYYVADLGLWCFMVSQPMEGLVLQLLGLHCASVGPPPPRSSPYGLGVPPAAAAAADAPRLPPHPESRFGLALDEEDHFFHLVGEKGVV